jgi:bifunctional non-homologous end joining protein LigD
MARADPLKTYREKRDFAQTPEPAGKIKKTKGRLFIVQKHAATRLHYDFRLELDGVLKSWAVTKGPSFNPADKRLAVRTEDHPYEYGGFEGVIPSGYGAGTVLLWDRGEWRVEGDPHEGLARGQLKFVLDGERLKGKFALIRLKPKPGEKKEHWLLIKERDAYADPDFDPTTAWTESVKSGRDLDAIAKDGEAYEKGKNYTGPRSKKKSVKRAKKPGHPPRFVPLQLASLREEPPGGDDWLHEIKFDGYRVLALLSGGAVKLITRNQQDYTERYLQVARALAGLDVADAVIDGEMCAVDEKGRTSFSHLQQALGRSVELVYYAFDLLQRDGEDLKTLPLVERKQKLRALLGAGSGPLRYSEHIRGGGENVLKQACALGLEGIVSKRASAPYTSGRGTSWLKIKCTGNDEFVIGGYRQSDKRGRNFASLLVGEYVDGQFVYRGRVGTGFDEKTLEDLARRMAALKRDTSPFAKLPAEARRGAVWVKPELVAQVAYTEKTSDGILRHPAYLGLREDKPAKEVSSAKEKASNAGAGPNKASELVGVKLTNPGRVYWPEPGFTKLDLARYFSDNSGRILPFLSGRPLSIVRCPDGADEQCFFQKHHNVSTPKQLKKVMIEERAGKKEPYLMIDDVEGLVAAAQMGALELHLWGARADKIEKPERIVFDLDPDEGLSFARVRDAAFETRDVLAAAGLKTFAMLTGGKGVHVIAPIDRRRGWDEVKAFSKALAEALARAAPERYVAGMAKARRKGKIFIDYLRNERGSTAIAPYSTRRRANASVATPISWDELRSVDSADEYTLSNISRRLSSLRRDPWAGYFETRQSISQAQIEALT